MPKLSICVPTYNRSSCLAQLLDSILAQGIPEIEVVVSDDASSDNTAELVEQYRPKFKCFTFVRQIENIGLDRNFIEVTRAAAGDYLWLMGDDDRLEPGGAVSVLSALERWPNVVGLTVGVIDYDSEMLQATGVRAMPKTQLISGASQVFSKIAELLGFMSAMVVNRQRWMAARDEISTNSMNNLYSQVHIAGVAIGRSGNWGVVNELCVGFRSDNDQFKRKLGWFERLKVDARAYDEIADRLFYDDPTARKTMRRRVFDSHLIARLINSKTDVGPTIPRVTVALYLVRHYGWMPHLWTRALPIVFAPKAALEVLRSTYKRFSTSSGAARARQIGKV